MREFLPLLCVLALTLPLPAQEEVNPATKPGQVQITFLPPPMEGTVSLGIYTIELFFGWAFIGLIAYFFYGRRHSQLALREQGDINAN